MHTCFLLYGSVCHTECLTHHFRVFLTSPILLDEGGIPYLTHLHKDLTSELQSLRPSIMYCSHTPDRHCSLLVLWWAALLHLDPGARSRQPWQPHAQREPMS